MGAPKAQPVTIAEIQTAKGHLENAVSRLTDALKTLINAPLTEVEIRNHIAMKNLSKRMAQIASEVRDRAEDAKTAQQEGGQTAIEKNRQHHAIYDKPKIESLKKKSTMRPK